MRTSVDKNRTNQECIMFSTADWDEPYWTNKQHTAKSLSECGYKVLYIESVGLRAPNVGSKKDLSRIWNRLKKGLLSVIFGAEKRDDNIWVLAPLLIPAAQKYPILDKFNTALLRWLIKRHCKVNKFKKPLVWTYHPFILNVISEIKHWNLVYHCVDDLSAVPGIDKDSFTAEEDKLLIQSDKVYVTTKNLERRCIKLNSNTEYLSNVADFEHFSQAIEDGEVPDEIKSIPHPRLVYHGVLSDFKVDFQLLIDVATLNPDLNLVILGEEREGQQSELLSELREISNVYLLGYKSYKELPHYLRGMDVGLLPTKINQYTRSMFPMKYYEYLSAGLPVVSTPLLFSESVTDGMLIAQNSTEFSHVIRQQVKNGRLTLDQAIVYVGENTWKSRTEKMLNNLHSMKRTEK